MKIKITINNEAETDKFSNLLASLMFPGFVLLLGGELGAGKTRIAKGIGNGLGIKKSIKSPTFNILMCYEDDGRLPFYHIDAYRLEESSSNLGFEEFLYGEGVCLIEWYKYIEDILDLDNLKIDINIIDEFKREFLLTSKGIKYDEVIERLESYGNSIIY